MHWNGKGSKPKPIPRPGVEPRGKKYGKTTMTLEQMRARFGWDTPEPRKETD